MIFENQIKVLWIDDDSDILELCDLFLKEKRIDITKATSPEKAMVLLEEKEFDIIVSDYSMPGTNGMEIFQKIRAKSIKTPFIIFTGKSSEELAIEAINKGVDAYFLKGENFKEHIEEIAKQIEFIFLKKQVEKRFQIEAKKYKLLVENSHDIIYVIDIRGIIIFASSAWETLLGHSVGNVIGKSFKCFVHPEDIEKCEKILNERKKEKKSIEYRIRHVDGDYMWHHTNATPLIDKNNKVFAFQGSASDITQRKKLENDLIFSNKKIKIMSSITCHDINNCLMALFGYTELLLDSEITDSQKEHLNKMKELTDMINNQIIFSQDYKSIGVNQPKWQDISALLTFIYKEKISFRSSCSGLFIFADSMLEKVFFNLMDNTIRHANASRVNVSYEVSEKGVTIIWKDNGKGIPEHKKEKLFAPASGRHGLFLIQEILSITDITICENGNPERGARFEIFVPNGRYRIKEE
jgi:PAS domain S-box-containing protein